MNSQNRPVITSTSPQPAAYAVRPPLAVSVKQFCSLTSLGRTTAFKLISEGKIETLAVRGRTLILWRSIEALLGLGTESPDERS